jgi:hypothetical protein
VVTQSNLALKGEYETTADTHRSPGNLIWMPQRAGRRARPGGYVMQAVTPAITNTGSQPATIVVVQWAKAG